MNHKENCFNGDLTAKPGVVYDYTSVVGSVYARGADTKCAFPKLTSVGVSMCVSGADTKCAFPKLTSVGASVYASGEDTKCAFPKLTSVGVSVYASGDWKHVETGNTSCCRKMLLESFAKNGYSFADNMLARIISTKGRVSRVILAGKTKISYLVTDGEAWSHGETLKAARDGLKFKIGSRDTTEFNAWKLETKITLSQAIKSYRVITGACEQGVRSWMENKTIPTTMTIAQAIELTRGAYGNDVYANFFNNQKKENAQ
jgi:hypothetical protein